MGQIIQNSKETHKIIFPTTISLDPLKFLTHGIGALITLKLFVFPFSFFIKFLKIKELGRGGKMTKVCPTFTPSNFKTEGGGLRTAGGAGSERRRPPQPTVRWASAEGGRVPSRCGGPGPGHRRRRPTTRVGPRHAHMRGTW